MYKKMKPSVQFSLIPTKKCSHNRIEYAIEALNKYTKIVCSGNTKQNLQLTYFPAQLSQSGKKKHLYCILFTAHRDLPSFRSSQVWRLPSFLPGKGGEKIRKNNCNNLN